MKNKINPEITAYIQSVILPKYQNFDKGHDIRHVTEVIKRSLNIVKSGKLRCSLNMVYAIAAFHDYGMKIARENHAEHSGVLLRQDAKLRQWFSEEEIETMATAVTEHSTSRNAEPQSIYGKIVCDADKDTDIETSLKRALEFSWSKFPHLSFEQHLESCYEHLKLKFGENGLVKFYIPCSINNEYLEKIKHLAANRELVIAKFKKIALKILTDN